jgi:transposase
VPTMLALSEAACKQLVRMGRRTGDPATAHRFLMVARYGRGWCCSRVAAVLCSAVSTVAAAVHRFMAEGPEGLLDRRAHNGGRKVDARFLAVLKDVLNATPLDFGWERPTWTRELLALEMEQRGHARVSVSAMGRALAAIKARRGRPKPIVLCPWPRRKRQHVLRVLKRLAEGSTDKEPVFFADEVDIHLNPKIGLDWMNQGSQRRVLTPGKNQKHYVAGALNAATRRITWADGASKRSTLFCALVERLVQDYPKARRIHIILDNYIIHSSKITQKFLAQYGERVQLHFLPPYCPDHNRIERFWQELHANVTRNHRCKTIKELLRHAFAFLDDCNNRDHCNPSLRRAISDAA